MNTQEPVVRPALTQRDIRLIMVGLMVAMFPGALDMTIIGPALPTIGRELGDLDNLPWIASIYLLVSTAVTPLYGKLSDIYGRRITLLTAISLFAFGSTLCALAPTMLLLTAARAVQGLGGGGLVSLAMTVIGDIVLPRERPRYQVYTATMWTSANLLGPIAGGYFAEAWNWTLIFWINLPICLAAYLLTDSRLRRLPRYERPHKLDYVGAALIVIASGLTQLTLTWGGVHAPWTSPLILSLGAASVLCIGLFVWRLAAAAEPLIPIRLLASKITVAASATVGLTMGVYIAMTIYVPIYLETARGLTAGQSGLALLPLMVFSTIGAVAAGQAMIHIKRYKSVALLGLTIATLALIPLTIWPLDTSFLALETILSIVSIGVGAVFPITTISVQNSVAKHDLGTAMSLLTFMRNLGGALGVAVFGAIIASASLSVSSKLDLATLTTTFRWLFITATLGYGLALAALFFMDERPLQTGLPKPDRPMH